jgi:hypothetical protein
MGKMTVTIDADTESGKVEFKFTWNGDDEAVREVMKFIDKMADDAGVAPEALVQSALKHFPAAKKGIETNPGAQQVMMMTLLYAVLQLPTQQPDRPGAIYNYAATEDITAKLIVRDDKVTGEIEGHPLAH